MLLPPEKVVKFKDFEGKNLVLKNSANFKIKDFKIEGAIEQETREGYNLFNKETITQGEFLDNNGNPTIQPDACYSNYISVLQNEIYYFGNRGIWLSVCLYDIDKNFISRNTIPIGNYQIPNDVYYLRINVELTYINTFQLSKGSEEKPYEPYGASPSINYPSEVNGLGDNHNLFVFPEDTTANYGILNFVKKNEVSLTSTDINQGRITLTNPVKLKPNTDYTIYIDISDNTTIDNPPINETTLRFRLNNEYINITSSGYYHFKTPNNLELVAMYFHTFPTNDKQVTTAIYKDIMIYEGIEEKPFMSYKETIVKNNETEYLLDFTSDGIIDDLSLYEGEIPYLENDKVYYDKQWEKYTFTGSEDENWAVTNGDYNNSFKLDTPIENLKKSSSIMGFYSNRFTEGDWNNLMFHNLEGISIFGNKLYIFTSLNGISSVEEFKQYLKNNETYIIYPLKIPIKTEITGELAEQIKNLYNNISTQKGETQISIEEFGKISGQYLLNSPIIEEVLKKYNKEERVM